MISNDIDGIDNMIIELLLKDGRISYSEIGEHIGLSRTAVKNRISALEEKGILLFLISKILLNCGRLLR